MIYDKETDSLSMILREGKVAESDEVSEGLIFHRDVRSAKLANCRTTGLVESLSGTK